MAPGQQGALVESCLMLCIQLSGAQEVSAAPRVLRDGIIQLESQQYSSEGTNKVLNDTEEGITMSAVPQCYEIPL